MATTISRVGASGRVRSWHPAAIAFIAVGVLAMPLAIVLNIWQDESYTLHSIAHGPVYAFVSALRFEQSAPLYFVLLSLMHALSGDIWFLRGFSVLCAAIAAALTPSIARRYVPAVSPVLLTIAVVWNPFFLWAAVEMRPYAMIVAVSAGLLRVFYDAFLSQRPPRYTYALYAALIAIAAYTQFYLWFLVCAQGLAVVIFRRDRLGRFLVCALAGAIVFLPLAFVVPAQVANFRGAFAPPSLQLSIASVALAIGHYIFPLGTSRVTNLAYAALALAFIAIAVVARKRFGSSPGALDLIVLVAASIFVLTTFVAHVLVLNRHVASLYLPAVAGVYGLFALLDRKRASIAVTVWFALTLLASTVGIATQYAPMAKPGDWIRVTAYLHEHEATGEPIAVFEAENALPLAYYYRGPNRVVAIPRGVNFSRYDVGSFVVKDAHQLAQTVPSSKRIWFITAGDCRSGNLNFGCDVIERFIAQHYTVRSDAAFYKSRVRLLERKTNGG